MRERVDILVPGVMVVASTESVVAKQLGTLVAKLVQSRSNWKDVVKNAIPILLETAKVAG